MSPSPSPSLTAIHLKSNNGIKNGMDIDLIKHMTTTTRTTTTATTCFFDSFVVIRLDDGLIALLCFAFHSVASKVSTVGIKDDSEREREKEQASQ